MLKYYLSPSGLSLFEYSRLCREFSAFGWHPTLTYPSRFFDLNFKPTSYFSEQAVQAISSAELFIAFIPGRFNTSFEIGLAYAYCSEIVLVSCHDCYFTAYNNYVSHHALLPGIVKIICSPEHLPEKLRSYYLYLVAN